MDLTSENVYSVFSDCFFRDGEDTSHLVKAEAIVQTFGFHPERLASHRKDIASLLAHLPRGFRPGEGGGLSFLSAVLDSNGQQWGEQTNAEQLLALGIASGLITIQFPRNMWSMLPGGVPDFVLSDEISDAP